MKLLLVCLFLAISVANAANNAQFKGFKVYSVEIKDKEIMSTLHWMQEHADEFGADFWSLHAIIGSTADIMVNPSTQEFFEKFLMQHGIDFVTKIDDLQREFDQNERESRSPRRLGRAFSGTLDLSRYYSYPEITEYVRSLEANYPNLVQVEVIGKSYENRDILGVSVCYGPNKPTVLVDAGIHAREWIAPASALYAMSQLVEVGNNTDLCNDLSFVFIPSANPDGYQYSRTSNSNWRKTRKPSSSLCVGTDGNRNFGYFWGGAGASTNPCSDTYRGENAFSEPETAVIRDFMARYADTAKFYLTIHSYGRYILYPWGYEYSLPDNWRTIDQVAQAGAEAVRAYNGARYSVGGSANVLYVAAGGSDDYALGEEDIPISITFECAGSTFTPPAAQIHSLVVETYIAIRAMLLEVVKLYGKK